MLGNEITHNHACIMKGGPTRQYAATCLWCKEGSILSGTCPLTHAISETFAHCLPSAILYISAALTYKTHIDLTSNGSLPKATFTKFLVCSPPVCYPCPSEKSLKEYGLEGWLSGSSTLATRHIYLRKMEVRIFCSHFRLLHNTLFFYLFNSIPLGVPVERNHGRFLFS